MTKKNKEDNTKYMPIGMCMGISIGTAIGAAMDNIPVCMAVGLSVGMCIGSLIDAKNRKTDKLQPEDEEEE